MSVKICRQIHRAHYESLTKPDMAQMWPFGKKKFYLPEANSEVII